MAHTGDPRYVYVAERWEDGLRHSTSALESLREIYPEHHIMLTETGARAVDSAMEKIKGAVVDLHRAGRHVLGTQQYEDFMDGCAEQEDTYERGEVE